MPHLFCAYLALLFRVQNTPNNQTKLISQWKIQMIVSPDLELPRINYEEYNGKKYQFFYASSGDHKKVRILT